MRHVLMIAAAAATLCAGGCVNEDVTLYGVRVTGRVQVAPEFESAGVVQLGLYFASAGEGELAFLVDEIELRELGAPGSVDEWFLVPLDEREGLLVYAWLDVDGDGVHCAVGGAEEPAGLVAVDDFTDHAVSFALVLDQACAGPEALYP